MQKERINNKSTIKTELEPLMKQVKDLCHARKIPFFFAALSEETGSETLYYTEHYSNVVAGVDVSDDRIIELINVMNGFNAVPPGPSFEDFNIEENI